MNWEDRAWLGGLAAVTIWIVAVLPFLYGPPPRFREANSPPQAHTEQPAQNANTEPRGNADAPFAVQVLPTPKTAEEKSDEAKEREEKASTDWWLMAFTGAVAFFTLALVGVTSALWYAGEKQIRVIGAAARRQLGAISDSNLATRQAAEAAERSAEALINAQRAHLFVVIEKHNIRDALRGAAFYGDSTSVEMQDSQLPNMTVWFFVKNMGRTAALMTEVGYRLVQRDFNHTQWEYGLEDTIVDPVIEGASRTDPPTACDIESVVKVRDGHAALNGTRPIFFYGHVGFRDSFKREYRYFWRYEYRGQRFVLVYEYEQKIAD
jgi:hypothetical protein